MLRRDTSARFVKSGISVFSRYRFHAGRFAAPRSLNRGRYDALLAGQQEAPVVVAEDEQRRRRWWWFRDEFYWEDDAYEAREVQALILEREGQKGRRLKRAMALLEQGELSASAREPISDEVRAFVWNRDGGRCIRCGSQDRLEFDHIIPVALGGANTARNLQLLCEICNRSKGASVV